MSEQLEVRIIAERLRNGKVRVSTYDPRSLRKIEVGLPVLPAGLPHVIRQLKTTLERAGNYVTVKEM